MKDCFSCFLISMSLGFVIGGLLVSTNKTAQDVFSKGKEIATTTIEDVSKKIKDKSKKQIKQENN